MVRNPWEQVPKKANPLAYLALKFREMIKMLAKWWFNIHWIGLREDLRENDLQMVMRNHIYVNVCRIMNIYRMGPSSLAKLVNIAML